MTEPSLTFNNPEELKATLRLLSARLHYVNRVAAGESRYVWHLAELLDAVGQMADLIDDKSVKAEFGDGWSEGSVPRDEQANRMLTLLRDRM